MKEDYYKLLGLKRDADPETIRDAYRTSAKRTHPDLSEQKRNPQDFIKIKEAYDVLKDCEKKRRYDRQLNESRESAGSASADRGRRFGPENMPGRGSAPFEEVYPQYESRRNTSTSWDFDLHLDLVLSGHEAWRGGGFPIHVPFYRPCPNCASARRGKGLFCPVCSGRGSVRSRIRLLLNLPPGVMHGTHVLVGPEYTGYRGVGLVIRVLVDPLL
jgi:molecular chaperone DnaJ